MREEKRFSQEHAEPVEKRGTPADIAGKRIQWEPLEYSMDGAISAKLEVINKSIAH